MAGIHDLFIKFLFFYFCKCFFLKKKNQQELISCLDNFHPEPCIISNIHCTSAVADTLVCSHKKLLQLSRGQLNNWFCGLPITASEATWIVEFSSPLRPEHLMFVIFFTVVSSVGILFSFLWRLVFNPLLLNNFFTHLKEIPTSSPYHPY